MKRVTYVQKGDVFRINAFGVNLVLDGKTWVDLGWTTTAEMLRQLRKENPNVEFVKGDG
jgi:hypothetical protein